MNSGIARPALHRPVLTLAALAIACGLCALALNHPGRSAAGPQGGAPADSKGERSAALEQLLKELEANRRANMNVPRKDGEFLNLMVKTARAKDVLEVGTSNGYSAIWLALALEETDGHLTTIEIDPARLREARANLARAGLSHRVSFLEGDAHHVVRTLESPFDFIFLDADKGNEMGYFNVLFPRLRPGGMILVHNAIRQGSVMREYLDHVSNHPELDTLMVSVTMDDGFAVSRRRAR